MKVSIQAEAVQQHHQTGTTAGGALVCSCGIQSYRPALFIGHIQRERNVIVVDGTFTEIVGILSRDSGTRDLAAFGSASLADNDPEA